MIGGIGRDTAFRIAGVLSIVSLAVVFVGLTLGLALSGASSPLGTSQDVGADGDRTGVGDTLHENPATLEEERNLGALEERLASQIAQQVESGAVNVTQEDYEQAREQLGDEQFDELVDEYGDIAEETGNNETYSRLDSARGAQQNYTDYVAAYWVLYDKYQLLTAESEDPNQSGEFPDDAFARTASDEDVMALARQLEIHAQRANESATRAIRHYQELSTGDDEYRRTATAIARSQSNVTAAQQTVRTEQFTATNLVLFVTEATISTDDPLVVLGRLETADGRLLANRTATFEVADTTLEVRTDASGRFRLSYRPTLLPVDRTTLPVTYRPGNDTAHLSDTTTVTVTVEQTEPTVTASVAPDVAKFDDTVTVTGAVTADDVRLARIPYTVAVDGIVVATDETDADGRIEESFQLSGTVSPGDATVTIRLPLTERALAGTVAEKTVSVERREAFLAAETAPAGTGTVRVSGQLTTDDGVIPAQPLEVLVNDTVVGTVRTDANGSFDQRVVVPDEVDDEGAVAVDVRFEGRGTNLEPAGVTTTTRVETGGGFSLLWAVPVVLLLAALGGGTLLYRSRRGRVETVDRTDSPHTPLQPSDESTAAGQFEYATDLLEAGDTAGAVRAGYAALRHQLSGGQADRRTHWEFYHDCRDQLDPDSETSLREATEYYERVAFADEPADDDMAREVIDAVERLGELDAAGGPEQ